MSLRKFVGLVSAAALSSITIYGLGCSSSTTPVTTGNDSGTGAHDTGARDSTLADVFGGGDTGDAGAGACVSPTALPGFTPVTIKPLIQAVCNETIVNKVMNDCFGSTGTATACNADLAVPADKTCFQCITTNYSGTTMLGTTTPPPPAVSPWGPLIGIGNFVYPNTGACIALADPAYAACGQSLEAVLQCEYDACDAICPVSATATSAVQMQEEAALQACQTAADNGPCMSYITASNTACASVPDGGGTAAFCLDSNLFSDAANLDEFILQQCGGLGDGGITEAGPG